MGKLGIKNYDNELAKESAKKTVKEGIDPEKILDTMTEAIREIGEKFGKGELFLPDLVGAAEAMSNATPVVKEEIEMSGEEMESAGIVVLGTVEGDIHDIGKTMVKAFLTAENFNVIDLGVDIPAEEFLEAIRDNDPQILAMSALMTTTIPEQRKVIETLKEEGIRDQVKIMIGGAAASQEFADDIGADGYDPTAPGAAKLAKKLVQSQEVENGA
ncbi:hypothetical protein AKJ63_01785 [candidate division MSBL1 archaeon SCGC-AAA259D18]|uniref:Cobalamin-binding protein n=1 Tax=candidate division MSBL1 archaeon SCGC-AAA259D18 TaxID=1698262 RepID=A0A133UAM8_9EURY|nr:hypothetical protein AKJ63_01785 [candidate division MSBL1 archaeon SCGC-AAA259D18]